VLTIFAAAPTPIPTPNYNLGLMLLESFIQVYGPMAWWIIPLFILYQVATWPIRGRGPINRVRDQWRGFKHEARAQVLSNAGHRCEGHFLFTLIRCPKDATEVDHVIPWSKGGPTIVSNGQALCRYHNRSKGDKLIPWWHVLRLEKRRQSYFPQGVPVRVHAVMNEEEKAARKQWLVAKQRRAGDRF
jgi:hypothetical protein